MLGRRLEDTAEGSFPLPYDDLRPCDIWKILDPETGNPIVVADQPSNLTGAQWMAIAPGPASDSMMFANLTAHTVREHDDGTVSVRPGDGSSNSILVSRRADESWHGYIEHNVWTAC